MRSAKVKSPVPPIVTESDIPTVAENYIDEEEKVEQQMSEMLKQVSKPKASARQASGSKSSASRKTPAKLVQKAMEVNAKLDREYAAKYIPQVTGCSIYKDTKLHMRWSASYPTASPPHSTSQAFGVSSDRDAMLHCLRWLWTQHAAHGGGECPFALE